MKKFIAIFCLLLLLSLTSINAYGVGFGNDDGNVRISLPILVNYNLVKEYNNSDQVSIQVKNEMHSDDYVSINIYKPVVTISNNKGSEEKINLKINNIINSFKNKIVEDSIRDNKFNKENGLPIRQYVVNVNNTIHYNKENILSLTIHLYSFTGGAHGSSTDISLNIDTNTGNNGVLKDFLGNNENFDSIILKSIKETVAKEPEMYFKESIDKLNKLPYNQKFYLNDSNIVVYFDEYEIAPYVAGSPEFKIPLSNFPKGLNSIDIKKESPNVSTIYINEIGNINGNVINKYISLPLINTYSSSKEYDVVNKELKELIIDTVSNMETSINIKGITTYFFSFIKDKDVIDIFITYVGSDIRGENILNISKEYIVDLDLNKVIKK